MTVQTLPPSQPVHPALVILALAVGAFAIGTTEFAAMSLLPYFARDLGLTDPQAGHAISMYALGVVVGAPIFSVLGARLSRRTMLIGLMAIFAVGNALSAMASSYSTLLLFRFLAGLPHGAFFGVAALVAASLVPAKKRAQAVAKVFLGLTIATIIGVPAANLLGQIVGWRYGFGIVAFLAMATMALVALYAPRHGADPDASPLRELGAFKRPQVLLTLLTGVIGFGGMFCVYTYLASTMIEVTKTPETLVPVVLAVYGVGMTAGNLFWAWLADRDQDRAAIIAFVWVAIALALFPLVVENVWLLAIDVLLIGFGGGLGTILQTRLMDVAGDAQALAAAAHHSAFNTANALGPWLGGLAITAGLGLPSTGWIGAVLSLGGLAVYLVTLALYRRDQRQAALAMA
ncbi:MAG: MFS transporter [Pseudomonadota bacterium]|uniref:MFS transporter n=1 Tax=Novosphingobium sp. MBES04 TaxID=1206458 RepID=UPI00057EAB20|nr:MFS transporter [Novosphingobium sp. MBES04]MED5547450.1 MFS transporter [Pseudomonadota bacterium]GAM05938.1 arabinose polymer transporter [Novosphingobium sp. MBES04]